MDPATAIGLASAVISFVEFSSTLIAGARTIHSSTSGATIEYDEANQNINRLRDLTRRLPHVVPTQALTDDDKKLLALKEGCKEVSGQLEKMLEQGRAKVIGSRRASLRASWNNIWNRDKITSLQSRLDRYRGEVLAVVLGMLNDDVSETKKALEALVKAQPEYAESCRQDLIRARDSIITVIHTELQASQKEQQARAYEQQASIEKIQKDLTQLLEMTKLIPAQDAILDVLYFKTITRRQGEVKPAHKATFRWLLYEGQYGGSAHEGDAETSEAGSEDGTDPSNTTMVQKREQQAHEQKAEKEKREAFLGWLSRGNGVFYISGKAGAGKSTLMKFLYGEEKTHQELRRWAERDGKQLILARFFFWISGDQLQKSLEGLYRAILWDILRQFPDLIPLAFPDTWSSATSEQHRGFRHRPSSELDDLHAALDRILTGQTVSDRYKICLFVDGLDEYDGDFWKLSRALASWASADSVKFCVSSRPYNEFLTIFASNPSRHLQLHDLTRLDILNFVRSEFQNDERSAAIRENRDNLSSLIRDIVQRSDGVFLWVRLVTDEVLKAMGNHYSFLQLRKRLDNIPGDLDDIYQRMFGAIDKADREAAARILIMCMGNPNHPNDAFTEGAKCWVFTLAMMVDIMDEPFMLDSILEGELEHRKGPIDWQSYCQIGGSRLIGMCNGLVEVDTWYSDLPGDYLRRYSLKLIHRSTIEFLSGDKVHEELLKMAGGFCPWRALNHSMLAAMNYHHSLSYPDVSSIMTTISVSQAMAEVNGYPPLTKETTLLIQMCQSFAEANQNDFIGLNTVLSGVVFYGLSRTRIQVPLEGVESAIVSYSIINGSFRCALARIAQNRALMTPRHEGTNILLSAAVSDMRDYHPDQLPERPENPPRASDNATDLLVHHLLKLDESSVNAPSFSYWLKNRNWHAPSARLYCPNPPWTTWTSFLYQTSIIMQNVHFSHTSARRRLLNVLHEFLEHGAEASACFILCDTNKVRKEGDTSERLNGLKTTDVVSFVTLPTMIQIWELPSEAKILQLMNNQHPQLAWGLFRVYNILRRSESQKLVIKQLDSRAFASGNFTTIKVVAFNQMQRLKQEDLGEMLEEWTHTIREDEPRAQFGNREMGWHEDERELHMYM